MRALAARGYRTVSHNTVWKQLRLAGFSKKNAVRRGAVAASDRAKARAVEEVPGVA